MFSLVAGLVVGFAFAPKIAAVALACTPLLIAAGYSTFQIVSEKDEVNKKAHEQSAAVACEAAASIRTVASLTRENACCNLYGQSLVEPLKKARRSTFWSMGFFGITQGMSYLTIALVSWYGSKLLIKGEYDTMQYFVCFMASVIGAQQAGSYVALYRPPIGLTSASTACSRSFLTYQQLPGRQLISSSYCTIRLPSRAHKRAK
jgi:ATP-binding cassette subfamily B (MDR/TAP) protein 1